MNPSTAGWITKFVALHTKDSIYTTSLTQSTIYNSLLKTGFIYGNTVKSIVPIEDEVLNYTKQELTKINLLYALLTSFFIKNPKATETTALKTIVDFYTHIENIKPSFFQRLSFSTDIHTVLEHLISARLSEANALFKREPSSVLTYALLYCDVLSFQKFLETQNKTITTAPEIETVLMGFCFLSLKSKHKKNKYDKQLIQLFETASDYTFEENFSIFDSLETLAKRRELNALEKKYIITMCCLVLWEDREMDSSEFNFLSTLTELLNVPKSELSSIFSTLLEFTNNYEEKIAFFEYAHPINQFYKQTTKNVKLLILRNKNRLLLELNESGELLVLLGQSTLRELNKEEKKKVKEQLLDICKTIPSLTIFLVPGGSLLLPILIKFIPKLLPSAFRDNKIETSK